MKLIVITPEKNVKNEHAILHELFLAGLKNLHIRKPDFTAEELREYLKALDPRFLPYIAIHSHQEIVSPELELRRVHFPEAKRLRTAPVEFELMREKGFFLSTSVHHFGELKKCAKYFHRIFLGPVFNSISKKGYRGRTFPILNLQREAEIIGIGGVKNSNVSNLHELGYDGAAFLGWIWENPAEAVNRFKSVIAKWELQDHTS